MYKISPQQNFAGNNSKAFVLFSHVTNHDKYLWLKDPFATNNPKQEKINKASAVGFVLMAASLLMFSKGVQKNSKKFFEKINAYFDKKIDKSILYGTKPKNRVQSAVTKSINTFLHKAESLNNITSLKDILFMKFMYKTKPTQKIHSSISELFENISRETVNKSYKKTQKKFNSMYDIFEKLDEYILKNYPGKIIHHKNKNYTCEELVALAKNYRENVKIVADAFMMPEAIQARYDRIKGSTSSLYSEFWNESFKDFWSKDNKFKRREMWQTFIAAERVKANRTGLARDVSFSRYILSYTPQEKSAYITRYIKNLKSIIPYEDLESADILKRMECYVKDLSALTDNRENFLRELDKFEKLPLKLKGDENFIKSQQSDKSTYIDLIRDMVVDDDKGELGDMLDIYRQIVPFELSKTGALKQAKKAVESFDKSVHLETEEFFDKLRDLELGSAPTDILTLVISSWMILLGLEKAKSYEEKKSVMLKSGIPVIGGIVTTMISTTKLVSGGKSLALGILSGLVLNRAGVIADKISKNLKATSQS